MAPDLGAPELRRRRPGALRLSPDQQVQDQRPPQPDGGGSVADPLLPLPRGDALHGAEPGEGAADAARRRAVPLRPRQAEQEVLPLSRGPGARRYGVRLTVQRDAAARRRLGTGVFVPHSNRRCQGGHQGGDLPAQVVGPAVAPPRVIKVLLQTGRLAFLPGDHPHGVPRDGDGNALHKVPDRLFSQGPKPPQLPGGLFHGSQLLATHPERRPFGRRLVYVGCRRTGEEPQRGGVLASQVVVQPRHSDRDQRRGEDIRQGQRHLRPRVGAGVRLHLAASRNQHRRQDHERRKQGDSGGGHPRHYSSRVGISKSVRAVSARQRLQRRAVRCSEDAADERRPNNLQYLLERSNAARAGGIGCQCHRSPAERGDRLWGPRQAHARTDRPAQESQERAAYGRGGPDVEFRHVEYARRILGDETLLPDGPQVRGTPGGARRRGDSWNGLAPDQALPSR
mmetsp:Transcript_45942/g.109129  ORF Transcript_45942/g.109129 Transcript_45942/m.109129 type:complete len:453 (-) Transcript_45942:1696-3054(-)